MATVITENVSVVEPDINDSYDRIVNYLLFNRSIISEEDRDERISTYINIVKSVADGNYSHIEDPLDRILLSIFETVLREGFDPWDIDLTKFSSLYFKHIKESLVNIAYAGKILNLAWEIVKLKTEHLIDSYSSNENDYNEDADYSYDASSMIPVIDDDMVNVSDLLLDLDFKPKTATLLDIVKEIENIYEREVKRKNVDREPKVIPEYRIEVHGENITEDMMELYSLVEREGKIILEKVCSNDLDKTIRFFIAMLFLVYNKKVIIEEQKDNRYIVINGFKGYVERERKKD